MLRIYHAYAESTLSTLICRNKGTCNCMLLCPCYEWTFFRQPTSLTHEGILGPISIIFEQAIHRFSNWIWVAQFNFFDWHLGLGLFALCLKCTKSASKHRGIASILGGETVWRSWWRCSWILFIWRIFFSKWSSKSYHEKTVLKTLQLEFSPAAFIRNVKIWNIMYQ